MPRGSSNACPMAKERVLRRVLIALFLASAAASSAGCSDEKAAAKCDPNAPLDAGTPDGGLPPCSGGGSAVAGGHGW